MGAASVRMLKGTKFLDAQGNPATGALRQSLMLIDGSKLPNLLESHFTARNGTPFSYVPKKKNPRTSGDPVKAYVTTPSADVSAEDFPSDLPTIDPSVEDYYSIYTTQFSNIVYQDKGLPDTSVFFSKPVRVEIPIRNDILNPAMKRNIQVGDEMRVEIFRPGILRQLIARNVMKTIQKGTDSLLQKITVGWSWAGTKTDTLIKDIYNINTDEWAKTIVYDTYNVYDPIIKDTIIAKPILDTMMIKQVDTVFSAISMYAGTKIAKVEKRSNGDFILALVDVRPGTYSSYWGVPFYNNFNVSIAYRNGFEGYKIPLNYQLVSKNYVKAIYGNDYPNDFSIVSWNNMEIQGANGNYNESGIRVPDLGDIQLTFFDYYLPLNAVYTPQIIGRTNASGTLDLQNCYLTKVTVNQICNKGLQLSPYGYSDTYEVNDPQPQSGAMINPRGRYVGSGYLENGVGYIFYLAPDRYYEGWSTYNGVMCYFHFKLNPAAGENPVRSTPTKKTPPVVTSKVNKISDRVYELWYQVDVNGTDLCN
jgi:hypothetical protein